MIYEKIFVPAGELNPEVEPRTFSGQQRATSAAEVQMDSARFSGLSWAGAVRQSAELLSISTQRLSASAKERG